MVIFLLLEFLQPFSYLGMKGLRFPTFQAVDAVEHSLEKIISSRISKMGSTFDAGNRLLCLGGLGVVE